MITKCTKWAVRVAPDCKFGSHQGGGGDHCRAAAAAFGCFGCFCCSFNSSNFPTQQGSPQNADFSVPVEGSGDSKVRFLGETFSSFSSSVDRTVPESSNHPPATSSRQRGEREKAVDGARESALHSLWVVASTDDTREDEEEDEKTSRYRAVERTACGKNQSDELVVVVVV